MNKASLGLADRVLDGKMANIGIAFHGGAREVGGSAIIVETPYCRIALDYGIKVDEGLRYDLPRDLDAVVVTHAHLDHSGNLLTLSDSDVAVVGSEATRDITMELLNDLLNVHKMKGKPLPYKLSDVGRVYRKWLPRERVALPGMGISLYPAGHVLGARMVHMEVNGKSLLYTGDFCLHDTEILNGAEMGALPKEPDLLIMESTYGGTTRPSRAELVNEFYNTIEEAEERGGNILIPIFAFHRMQETVRRIEFGLEEGILPEYNAYYLSSLAYRINKYFNEHIELLKENIRKEKTPFNYRRVRHLKNLSQIREPAIVACTAGFGQAGFSRKLLFNWVSEEDNTILISTGFLPDESPLLAAMNNDFIEDEDERYPVRATVKQVELSGHADQNELVEFVKNIRPKNTFLVHGDLEEAESLQRLINSFTEVIIPAKGERFEV